MWRQPPLRLTSAARLAFDIATCFVMGSKLDRAILDSTYLDFRQMMTGIFYPSWGFRAGIPWTKFWRARRAAESIRAAMREQ